MTTDARPLPSGDRNAPRRVEPVLRGGVRYEQNLRTSTAEFGQMGGVLSARDDKTGKVLWSLKVYDNKRRGDGLEGDVQDVFFREMAFDAAGRLVIVNERGRRFAVDVATRQVEELR